MIILTMYIAIFAIAFFAVSFLQRGKQPKGFNSLKTVTFGDESAVVPNRAAAFISVITIFLIWGAFTGSKLVPIHVPGPFVGETSFTYTAKNAAGSTEDATVTVLVHKIGEEPDKPATEERDGFTQDDSVVVGEWRSKLINAKKNDTGYKENKDAYQIVAIDGKPIEIGGTVEVADGNVVLTEKRSLNYTPTQGLQIEPIWMPAPEAVVGRFIDIAKEGYQNFGLWDHLGWSLFRVVVGFLLGALVGIPLGYAMGLSSWFRGWFDPIVEFMRPVPPLALIPLVIIWFGIWGNRQDRPAVLGLVVDHDDCCAGRCLRYQHHQGTRRLFARRIEKAIDVVCHRSQFLAGNFHGRASCDGRLLGHSGCS